MTATSTDKISGTKTPQAAAPQAVKSAVNLRFDPPRLRTPEVMRYDSRRSAPGPVKFGSSDQPVEVDRVANRNLKRKHFLPTMGRAKYAKLKQEAPKAAEKPQAKRQAHAAREAALAPAILVGPDFEGATDVDGLM